MATSLTKDGVGPGPAILPPRQGAWGRTTAPTLWSTKQGTSGASCAAALAPASDAARIFGLHPRKGTILIRSPAGIASRDPVFVRRAKASELRAAAELAILRTIPQLVRGTGRPIARPCVRSAMREAKVPNAFVENDRPGRRSGALHFSL